MQFDRARKLEEQSRELESIKLELDHRVVSLQELQEENTLLKRDLKDIDVELQKGELDRRALAEAQEQINERSRDLGARFLKDNVKWLGSSLTPNNYANSKRNLLNVINSCREIGFDVSKTEELGLLEDLKTEYERIVRAALEREEQTRIKAQIREEQAREREIKRELERLEREREAIAAALKKALAEAKDEHSAEVERLRARLAEAEAKSQRTLSQAQLTKSGHVYVISNVGSFGREVFKIGMTRRLEPLDRVRELGDASVPFPFDVHMMIAADDAPTLENALHRVLHTTRVNKANPRKEFFRTDIETIRKVVTENHGEISYVADAEALEYNQSMSMSAEDEAFIEHVYDEAREDDEGTTID